MAKNNPERKKANQTGIGALAIVLIAAAVIIVGVGGYLAFYTSEEEVVGTIKNVTNTVQKAVEEVITPPSAFASKFAEYKAVAVDIDPQVPAYTIAADLSNVTNKDRFYLSETAEEELALNGFVVTPGWSDEFFSVYEKHRYSFTPSFITTDSLLHNYHLLFDHLLRKVEEDYLIPRLQTLNTDMLATAQEHYDALQGTDWENAALRNLGFFTVGAGLLDSSVSIPGAVKNEVGEEFEKIEAHGGIFAASVINIGVDWSEGVIIDTPQGPQPLDALKEDYSQYVPRGHYDKTDELKAYFKSMMWYGRMTFRLKNPDEVRSALLMTYILSSQKNIDNWDAIYEPTNFFVGKSDDITYYELKEIMDSVYGESPALTDITGNESLFDSFLVEARKLEPPQINSMPIFQSSIQSDREEEIKGFRFMGQRYTIDASIFQRLICREVGNKSGTMICGGSIPDSRMVPKGLDVTAAMGSDEAYNILDSMGETEYKEYPENMSKLKKYIADLDQDIWTQNLYWGWLYSLRPLTEEIGDGYPLFMTNDAWVRKDLNSYLGSWTELKHDTILYAKQAYAELGGGGGPEEADDRGYVEPRPYVFARLAALTKMTREGLDIRDMISDSMKDNLSKMETLATSLKTIAEKELNNEPRTDEEYELIRSYGGQLEHFWLEVNKEDMEATDMSQLSYLSENPAAIVADVATDPNGTALEEAIGKIDNIYVVVEVEGVIKIAQGGVFSYYEFGWPISDRLTDKKWRELLASEDCPDRPEWTSSFLVSD